MQPIHTTGEKPSKKVIQIFDGDTKHPVRVIKVDENASTKNIFRNVHAYAADSENAADARILDLTTQEPDQPMSGSEMTQMPDPSQTYEKITKMAEMMESLFGQQSKTLPQETAKTVKPEPVANPFESLNIPGLAEIPDHPRFNVIFDLGDAGSITAAYHWINIHYDKLHLIYDTRFRYGALYTPPMNVRQLHVYMPEQGKAYTVLSPDNILPFGVFQIVSMPIVQEHFPSATTEDRAEAPVAKKEEPEEGSFDYAVGRQIDEIRRSVLNRGR